MQVLISAAGRYNTFMLGVLALAMSALMIAACDSTIAPDTGATIESGDEIVLGKGHQVAVCHVGHKLPEYDPACTEDCGDAGKVDLIFVPQKAVGNHVGNPVHTYGGVSDYLPGDEGASGVGNEDTSDDGVYVDDGCVIPDDEETIFAVAYTDVDPTDGDGFKEGTDVLIAKWVDGPAGSPDGVLGTGDVVVTDRYPLDWDLDFSNPASFGNFTVRSHTLVSVEILPALGIIVGHDDEGDSFQFRLQAGNERYIEYIGSPSTVNTTTSFYDGFGVGGQPDVRGARPDSPSRPDQLVVSLGRPNNGTDDAHVDVEIDPSVFLP